MVLTVSCVSAASPVDTPAPTPTRTPTRVTRPAFSLSLPPQWRIIDPKAATFDADYRTLAAENADFGQAYTQESLKLLGGADLTAFDFTPGRSSAKGVTLLMVTTESLGPWDATQSLLFRAYAYQVRGAVFAANPTTVTFGNANGRRVSLDYTINGTVSGPVPVRETWFVAHPEAGGRIVLTFISLASIADAFQAEFQLIADGFKLGSTPLPTPSPSPTAARLRVGESTTVNDPKGQVRVTVQSAVDSPIPVGFPTAGPGLSYFSVIVRFDNGLPNAIQVTRGPWQIAGTDGVRRMATELPLRDDILIGAGRVIPSNGFLVASLTFEVPPGPLELYYNSPNNPSGVVVWTIR